MREKPHYRDMLVRLDEKFPDSELLSFKEVMEFLGKSYNTVNKYYGKYFTNRTISKSQLASLLA